MFLGGIVLIVLVALCVVLGAIYSYIYFTRINPSRGRKFGDIGGVSRSDVGGGASGGGGGTNMLMNFR